MIKRCQTAVKIFLPCRGRKATFVEDMCVEVLKQAELKNP